MLCDTLLVQHRPQGFVRQCLDFRNLVGSAKAIEEMQEGETRLQCCRVRNQSEILGFLHVCRAEHRPAGRTRRHDVAMIPEDGERLSSKRTRGHVKYGGRQLAGDFEHVRQHQEQPLRRGERGGQRPGLQRAVDGPGRAGFTLHLNDRRDGAPQILPARRRPGVRPFTHWRRRRDRVDGDDFVERVGHARDGFVGVDG